MRWLVWYFQSCFCKHEWQREEARRPVFNYYGEEYGSYTVVSATCTKCGWHRSYSKYG